MNDFMKKYLFLLLLFVSCSDDLDDTVFVPDPTDPLLPAYTEWGYNSFGAKYEREYFLSVNWTVPCKIIYTEGLLHFSLIGDLGYGERKMTLTFSFPVSKMTVYQDLLALNNTTIDLTNASCEVKINKDHAGENVLTALEGSYLTFRRAQLLRVDEVENRVILSGTFNIKFFVNGRPESITSGRFDMGINKDFYSHN
ncbi:hypothetical protein AGMMS49525_05130 [Bacteroidia bacterium]|nr:hypothetical protein AGMMS49525_05130 [Bacteroidia bacterium]